MTPLHEAVRAVKLGGCDSIGCANPNDKINFNNFIILTYYSTTLNFSPHAPLSGAVEILLANGANPLARTLNAKAPLALLPRSSPVGTSVDELNTRRQVLAIMVGLSFVIITE